MGRGGLHDYDRDAHVGVRAVANVPVLEGIFRYMVKSMTEDLYTPGAIDKEHIYELTARINDCLHFEFGVKNLYHRMIFTACALVAERYGGDLAGLVGRDYATFHNAIYNTLSKSLQASRLQNAKIDILLEEYSGIKMND